MLSLTIGLMAACAWAVHDLMVRKIGQDLAVLPMMLTVLAAGAMLLLPFALVFGDWQQFTAPALGFAVAGGVVYVMGMGGLYMAFSLAPVRLVAPILGAYPMVSLGLAAAEGKVITWSELLAVMAVVAGVAVVAVTGQKQSGPSRPLAAMAWAAAGSVGFALTFWLGQEAARQGDILSTVVVTRLVALALTAGIALALRSPFGSLGGHGKILVGMGFLDATALGFVSAAANLPNPEYAAICSSLFGILTILLAWRFLKETVLPWQWVGITTVFAGIAVLSMQA